MSLGPVGRGRKKYIGMAPQMIRECGNSEPPHTDPHSPPLYSLTQLSENATKDRPHTGKPAKDAHEQHKSAHAATGIERKHADDKE